MTRQCWVYPSDGSGPILKEEYVRREVSPGIIVMSDLPDFVSPIDRKLYSGRTGMREHNAKHDVVPTADLKGLPTTRPVDYMSREGKRARKEQIINIVNKNWKE